MKLARFSVNNPVPVNILTAGIIIAGLVSANLIVREFFPPFEPDAILVSVIYPGADPEEVEEGAVMKVEQAIQDLDGVQEVKSSIFEGHATVYIELDAKRKSSAMRELIKAKIDNIEDMPNEVERIEVSELEPKIPVAAIVIYGDVPETVLKDIAERTKDELLEHTEISDVSIFGLRKPEYALNVYPAQLEQYALTFDDVARAVGAFNIDVPGGTLRTSNANIRMRSLNRADSAEQIASAPVRSDAGGQMITVEMVADVQRTFQESDQQARYEGMPSVGVFTFNSGGQGDALRMAELIYACAERMKHEYATDAIHITVTTDISRFIRQRLGMLGKNALIGLTLVLLVLLVFVQLWVAFWTAMGLGIAMAGTIIIMYVTGQTINFISMVGLIVVLGMLVDDAIVVAENIFHRIEHGQDPRQAAIIGTGEVAFPVTAAILTSIVAFLPLAFLGSRIGEFLKVIPIVAITALSVSLFEAFVILPGHIAEMGRLQKWAQTHPRWYSLFMGTGKIARLRNRVLNQGLCWVFEKALRFVIAWRYCFVGLSMAALVFSFSLVRYNHIPFQFIQETDSETIDVLLEMSSGVTVERTREVLLALETMGQQMPEIKSIETYVGLPIADQFASGDPSTRGQVVFELVEPEKRDRSSHEIVAWLRESVPPMSGIRSVVFQSRQGGPAGKDIEILLRGDELEVMEQAVEHLHDLLNEYAGISDIDDNFRRGKLEIRLAPLPSAHLAGVSQLQLGAQLRNAVYGSQAQILQRGKDEVKVFARLAPEARNSVADLEALRIRTAQGGRVPLRELASLEIGRGFDSLSRKDGKRAFTITADVDQTDPSINTQQITNDLQQRLHNIGHQFPGVSVSFEGQRKETADAFANIIPNTGMALLIIYCIIAVVFRSYIQPLVVMLAIPFGATGAILGHRLFGWFHYIGFTRIPPEGLPFTMLSTIGLIALCGVVVNDSIVLVDFFNSLRRQGLGTKEAIIAAGVRRLRPILLTSLTTIFGVAPLMMEQSFQAQFMIPMAVSLAYGLAFATLLTLLVLPCMIVIMEDIGMVTKWLMRGVWEPMAAPVDHSVPHTTE